MKAAIAGAALIAILMLRRKKNLLQSVSSESAPDIANLQNQYSVQENLTQAAEMAAMGGGAGAALGGPIGFVVGTAVGWAAGLIALAIRGGVRMGLEIRKIVRKKYRELGFPNETPANEFLLFATMMGATSRILAIDRFGKVYVPYYEDNGKNYPEASTFNRQSLESYIDTFWTAFTEFRKYTPELADIISRLGRLPYGNPAYLTLDLEMGGKWTQTGEGKPLEDVPFLWTKKPRLGKPVPKELMVYTGRLAENPLAYQMALRWAARKFGVQNEPWCVSAINALTGGN